MTTADDSRSTAILSRIDNPLAGPWPVPAVIHYTVTATAEPKSAVFLSDEAPGTPRFRLTYRLTEGTLAVVFDIAPPGTTAFKTYVQGSARRK